MRYSNEASTRMDYHTVWSLGEPENNEEHLFQAVSLPPVAQLVRAWSLYLQGPWFESKRVDKKIYTMPQKVR